MSQFIPLSVQMDRMALMVCNVTSADEVIVPTFTYIAAVNPIKYIGAEPIFSTRGKASRSVTLIDSLTHI